MKSGWQSKIIRSADAMISEGVDFSKWVEHGDIFTLDGELASGKTTFVKGIAQGLGYDGTVTSPTFTLVNEYDADPPIIHMDCYREDDLTRWLEIGITEYFQRGAIVLIEWPDRIEPLLPENIIKLKFEHISENERKISII